jgi:TDG/mug DNA glycosylase family protein
VPVLPDYLDHGLRIIFCGTAVGTTSAVRGHYYAGAGNEFWRYLFEAGLTPRHLAPVDDVTITNFGIGLTDLAKQVAASNDRGLAGQYDVPGLVDKIERYAPVVVACHGKEAAKAVSRALGHGHAVRLGLQAWRIVSSRVFVVPSASGANRNAARLEGKPSRVAWFVELREFVDELAR